MNPFHPEPDADEQGGPSDMDADDKGGARMEGGLGSGAQAGSANQLREGYDCLAKFPLTGEFWTRPPKQGQA